MRDQDIDQQRENVVPGTGDQLRAERLNLLYQGILTSIVRIRSGQQPITGVPGFRKNILDTLGEVEREAARLSYRQQYVADASYAVIAFLDETVLASSDPIRAEWPPLHAELFGKAVAGEDFFRRLDQLRKQPNSVQLADTLEVYSLCLLLGYQGRYGRIAPGELRNVAEDLHVRIEQIRGREDRLSPEADTGPAPVVAVVKGDPVVAWLRWASVFLAVLLIIVWLGCKYHLISRSDEVAQMLQLK